MIADILITALGLMFLMAFIMACFMVITWVLSLVWFVLSMIYYCVQGEFPGDTILRRLHGKAHPTSRAKRHGKDDDRQKPVP